MNYKVYIIKWNVIKQKNVNFDKNSVIHIIVCARERKRERKKRKSPSFYMYPRYTAEYLVPESTKIYFHRGLRNCSATQEFRGRKRVRLQYVTSTPIDALYSSINLDRPDYDGINTATAVRSFIIIIIITIIIHTTNLDCRLLK